MGLKAEINWTENLQFVGRSDKGAAVVMDTLDGGSGPTPMQLLLMGVATCSAMDVVEILKKRRSGFTALKVNAQGEQAEEYPKRFTAVQLEFVVTGKGVKSKDVEKAVHLSVTKYCSAAASLNAEISHSFRIIEAA